MFTNGCLSAHTGLTRVPIRRTSSAASREYDALADPIGNRCTEEAAKYTSVIVREIMFALRSAYRLGDKTPLYQEYIACVP